MDLAAFQHSPTGRLVLASGLPGEYYAYVPHPLPGSLLALGIEEDALRLVADAERALGRLAGLASALPGLLPDPALLIVPALRQEAAASVRIEGTVITGGEAQRYEVIEAPPERRTDYLEFANYSAALRHGQALLDSGLPVSVRLVREIHARLMQGIPPGRASRTPGEFRTMQVVLGAPGATFETARFVPPPPDLIPELMRGWERFANEQGRSLPLMVQCALMHYQFETIHPFDDGNGRVGRLLIKLLLHERKALDYPLLILSAYLERHRTEYHDSLLAVSRDGDWARWLSFFMRGVVEQGAYMSDLIRRVQQVREDYLRRLDEAKVSQAAYRLLDLLFRQQTVTVRYVEGEIGVSFPTAQRAIDNLAALGILTEDTQQKRNRVFTARDILALFAPPGRGA